LSSKNVYDLDPERLATTDESGNRVYLYPEDVKGKWKNRRKIFFWFLIIFYLVLPWFMINGRPALMFNIYERQLNVMGFTIYGLEPILMFFLFTSILFIVAYLTSRLGRVWCGWACPQTVFIQTLFLKVESLIEGKARQRKALDAAPWTIEKISKRSLKWIIYTVICLHIAHTFVGYFIGPRNLLMISLHAPQENWEVFLATMIITIIFLLDFGWFREQFCIIACPYGRIQSVLMDENSLVVAYDQKRGEPRREPEAGHEGDCINCYHCVKVCPTGIDIRRGLQLECIHCTSCIDACDEIMRKVKRPEGLIRYATEAEFQGKKVKKFTIRHFFYLSLSTLFLGLFIFNLYQSQNLNMVFIRGKTPYLMDSNNVVTNQFTLKINHQGSKKYVVKLSAPNVQVIVPGNEIRIEKAEQKIPVFFKFAASALTRGTLKVQVELSADQKVLSTKEVSLVGPIIDHQ
jgi:cytochrome c oxidase accessory protein FixG